MKATVQTWQSRLRRVLLLSPESNSVIAKVRMQVMIAGSGWGSDDG